MIIVTGGAGFIGSNIAEKLKNDNEDVVVCDRIDDHLKLSNIAFLRNKRVLAPESLIKFIIKNKSKIKAIIHMGAISSTAEKNLALLLKVNVQFSKEIFQLANKYSIKFIYASSASTYGIGDQGFDDNNDLVKMYTLRPINKYGLSKYLFDLSILQELTINNYLLPSKPVGLKFFNVYGKNEIHKGFMMSPIPKFYSQIKKKGQLKLFKSHNPDIKNGMQSRDFVYIDDCVNIVNFFLKHKDLSGIYNVGSGKNETFLKVAKIIFKSLRIEENIKFIPTPLNIRAGYQYVTKANMKRIRDIGFKDKFTPINEGIKKYISEYLSINPINY